MPPVDYPGARQRLYLIRELLNNDIPGTVGGGLVRGTFLGVYREHTPEAALLTAQQDHPDTFRRSPVMCSDREHVW